MNENPHIEEVIIVRTPRGDGKTDVFRLVLQVFTKDGVLLAEDDPALKTQPMTFNL